MSDLIRREDAIAEVSKEFKNSIIGTHCAVNAIYRVPSVKRKGKWEKTYLDHEAFGVRAFLRYCSACNEAAVYAYNFCPNCGADMRGEEDEVD